MDGNPGFPGTFLQKRLRMADQMQAMAAHDQAPEQGEQLILPASPGPVRYPQTETISLRMDAGIQSLCLPAIPLDHSRQAFSEGNRRFIG